MKSEIHKEAKHCWEVWPQEIKNIKNGRPRNFYYPDFDKKLAKKYGENGENLLEPSEIEDYVLRRGGNSDTFYDFKKGDEEIYKRRNKRRKTEGDIMYKKLNHFYSVLENLSHDLIAYYDDYFGLFPNEYSPLNPIKNMIIRKNTPKF